VVALRKQNYSVYDIRRILGTGSTSLSVNALSVLLRQEGFARLPRRLDEERPELLRPEIAAAADVRELNLGPRRVETRCAGLFLFVPLMREVDLAGIVRKVGLPGSRIIPGEQAVRSLLALKLIGKERHSHVMDLVFDPGIALFAGLNVVPKRSYLAAYSSRVDARHNARLMSAWFRAVREAGMKTGGTSGFHRGAYQAFARSESGALRGERNLRPRRSPFRAGIAHRLHASILPRGRSKTESRRSEGSSIQVVGFEPPALHPPPELPISLDASTPEGIALAAWL